jgi:hypothetical protein
MKCFACDGSGVETCFHCDGQGECSYCKGEGRQSCPLCDGSGEEPHPDSFSEKARVPWPIRKIVEQHVAAHLPVEILEKLRDLHARGVSISTDPAFFHFGGGMTVRNLCRERPVTTAGSLRRLGRRLGLLLCRRARRYCRDTPVVGTPFSFMMLVGACVRPT